MKNHIVGLYTAIYQVKDIAKAKRWYSSFWDNRPILTSHFMSDTTWLDTNLD